MTCACTRQGGEGAELGYGVGGCTSAEDESHSKHSQMIKGYQDNLQHLTLRLEGKINSVSFLCRAAGPFSLISAIWL